MSTTSNPNILAQQLTALARTLEGLEGLSKRELTAAFVTAFVPRMPSSHGLRGQAPLDGQLRETAADAATCARECEEALASYDEMMRTASVVLGSTVIKQLGGLVATGKAKANERREECLLSASDARAELYRRKKAREDAQSELAKAKAAADEVARIKQELADMRATFG